MGGGTVTTIDADCRRCGDPVARGLTARETSNAAIAHAQEAHNQPYQGIRVLSGQADEVTASQADLADEYGHGKATAWQLTERSAEGGRSADYIEQRHMELNGPTADHQQRTPAETAWHRGYDAGADGSVSLLRELEKEDQEKEAG